MSRVSIVVCPNYELDEVKRAIRIAVEQSDFPELAGKKVLLKPNVLSDAAPEKCVSTHPMVLKAVIQLARDKGAAEIFVGDSPALQRRGFKPLLSQLYQVCEEENVEWVDFTKATVSKRLPIANHKVTMTSLIDEVDLTISLPKFKTHEFMYATGAMKNMFGLMPGTRKSAQHVRHPSRNSFAKMICGIVRLAKVEYVIMDAVVGMEGPGPGNGYPREIGKIIAGKDPLAVDIAQATMMGYEPMKIPIIRCALENQATGLSRIEDIEYVLFDANDLVMTDFQRSGGPAISDLEVHGDAEYLQRPTPVFDDNKCIHCRKCIEICPAIALAMEERQVRIDQSRCIRCYCCHEICPVEAITITH